MWAGYYLSLTLGLCKLLCAFFTAGWFEGENLLLIVFTAVWESENISTSFSAAATFRVMARAITLALKTFTRLSFPLKAFTSALFFYTNITYLVSLRLLALNPFVYTATVPGGASA